MSDMNTGAHLPFIDVGVKSSGKENVNDLNRVIRGRSGLDDKGVQLLVSAQYNPVDVLDAFSLRSLRAHSTH